MRILIAGDLVPTLSNIDLFNNADIKSLLGNELYNLWNTVESRIVNLEVPLIDVNNPIKKCGPNLSAPTSSIKGIKALNPSLLTLANNHILDQGENGLKKTEELLIQNNIPYVGVGKNVNDASKPYIFKDNNKTIGIYSCAENEFTIATNLRAGANPFDPLESLDHIQELKSKCDYVIVLYHGGKEHYRYPSPYLQKVSRKMVEKGADVIICQHSHCIGCYEKYNDSFIVYGQGNFIFDDCDNEFWNTSLLIEVEVTNKLDLKFVPIVKKKNVISIASIEEAKKILDEFNNRSKEILKDGFVQEKYESFAKDYLFNYIRAFSGQGIWKARIDKYIFNGKLIKRFLKKNNLLKIQNYIECEAHRELAITAIKGEINNGQ